MNTVHRLLKEDQMLLKSLTTILRGHVEDAAQDVVDANTVPLLRQQIRDCVAAHEAGRRAVATIAAQCAAERRTEERLAERLADLETRALAALDHGSDDLAHEAAAAIADIETELDGVHRTVAIYSREQSRLRAMVAQQKARLSELRRGERLAVATIAARQASRFTASAGRSTLSEAEATLTCLRERLEADEAAAAALVELDAESNADAVRDRLADHGFGTPVRVTADAVIARLRARQTATTC
ncbi:PspA/IM30 family protein [Pseudoruegeria sp. HB172150]|uniref:PspA/IM30 family protein n=1 Tax=Pseudoruegeria sp. HB172150 TaxID=2721164 RepID=UPI001C12FD4B